MLARIGRDELTDLLRGYGYEPYLRRGRRPDAGAPAAGRDARYRAGANPRDPGRRARDRSADDAKRPRWPMIVLRTPKGWTGPKMVDGKPVEGTWRAHQVPIAEFENPEPPATARSMDAELPAATSCSTSDGKLRRGICRARADRPSPHGRESARQWRRLAASRWRCRDFRDYAVAVPAPGAVRGRGDARARRFLRDVMQANMTTATSACSAPTRPRRTGSRRSTRLSGKTWMAEIERGRRPISPRRRPRDGGAERASLPGLAGGLSADRPARLVLLLRGLHPHRRFDVQPARQVAEGQRGGSRGARRSRRSTIC